ncbi:MAG TPA: sigma-70 family RNA polymerase sigma factor [Polyangiaceae bacterium]
MQRPEEPPLVGTGGGGTHGFSEEASGDDELMALAGGGSERAFDALVRRHQARVLRLAHRYLGDSALAADVAQNTFVALFRSRAEYRPSGRFCAYLYRLVLNQCRMARRSKGNRLRVLIEMRDFSVTPEYTMPRERPRDLEAALGELSEKLREVVILRFCAEQSYEEIAEALDLPTGTVKRRLFDAMAKLRARLEER